MNKSELSKKAKELVERKRKIIQAGLKLLIETRGHYSEENKQIANKLAEESKYLALERENLLKKAWEDLDTEVIKILEIDFFEAIREEAEKVRQKIDEIFGPSSKKG